ncbi:MAG: hypothetical protein SNJ81_04670 [Cyanobacteriota bacterium]
MNTQQLTLLNHATELLEKQLPHSVNSIPIPLPTSIAAKIAKVSPTTLSRAKNTGKLPYKSSYGDWRVEVYYAHHHAGKDYWKIQFSQAI